MMRGVGDSEWSGLSGILLPTYREWHNEGSGALHQNVPHCPKPTKELMYLIRENLYEHADEGVYDRFLHVIDRVADVAEHTANPSIGKNALKVLDNLQRQMPFILSGAVILGEPDANQ
jgi:hypothetical protein